MQVAREKPQFAEITVTTESSSTAATLLALFVKNVKPDAITIGWRPPSDSYVDIQMYEVGHVMYGRSFFYTGKGLVAVCHSFCIYLSLYNRYIHTSFIRKHSLRFISISSQLSAQWVKPPWGPSRDLNSGLPYSKPARYQLSHTAT
jgi:hypothetical protein